MQHFDIFPLTDFRRFLLNSNQFYTKFILSASNLLEYIACAGSQNQSQYFSLIAISSLVGFIIRRLADLTQFDAERHEGFILQRTAPH